MESEYPRPDYIKAGVFEGDLISREALKEDFKSRLALCNEWIAKAKDKETKIRASAVKAFIAEVIITIDNAPTVEYTFEEAFQKTVCENKLYCPARPQGEWIEVDITPMPYGGYTCNRKCNKCGYFTKEYRLNFCPNCGAKMRKGGAEA